MIIPEEPYEQHGDVNKVVFPCGFTLVSDGNILCIYYGAPDSSITVAKTSLWALLEWVEEHG